MSTSIEAKRLLAAALEEKRRRLQAQRAGKCASCGSVHFDRVSNEWFDESGNSDLGDSHNNHPNCRIARTNMRCAVCRTPRVLDVIIERIGSGVRPGENPAVVLRIE